MKLAASNIAWGASKDEFMYAYLAGHGFHGLELAPTRLFPKKPYEHIDEAADFARKLLREYHLNIASLQSIWYGRTENIFGTQEERDLLLDYTARAIRFSAAMNCHNLVFGCPRNRVRNGRKLQLAIDFFLAVAEIADKYEVAFALEPNPVIYNTDYLNYTHDAIATVNTVNHPGCKVNLDIGAMVANEENETALDDAAQSIHHVHLSEPFLKPIQERAMHKVLAQKLTAMGYDGYVSLEMGNTGNLNDVTDSLSYLADVFGTDALM